MQNFIIRLLICSLTMSALALLYMAVTPLLAKRYSVIGGYYAWLVIVLGLIIPFRPHFTNAFVKVNIPGNTPLPITRSGSVTSPAPVHIDQALPSAMPDISVWQAAMAVWLAGMIIFLAYHIMKHYRFLKLTARWSENITDQETLTLFQNLKAEMGVPQNIGLQFCDSIGSPMMTGFVNSRILLPAAEFAKDELYFILKHELVHYKQKDLWYKGLVLLATAVHWFNPVVYLMSKAINIQCELSCDEKVVRGTNTAARQFYSETIIGVVRYQSKLKTALSTNFYGGIKGMKKRIFSIMDMNRKKAGIGVLCSVLFLTLGTGVVFAANEEIENISETSASNTEVTPWISASFLPDPGIYSAYSSFGITISDDGTQLLYQGQPVRLFVDEKAATNTFYINSSGDVNLSAVRNDAGEITGIESITEQKAQEYYNTFFAEELNSADTQNSFSVQNSSSVQENVSVQNSENVQDNAFVQNSDPVQDSVFEENSDPVQDSVFEENSDNVKDTVQVGENKYDQYKSFGITYSPADEVLSFGGQRVKLFVDQDADGWMETLWTDDAGTVNLEVTRNGSNQITGIKSISDEKAQKYLSPTVKYE
ncbi:MAG: M56 family metallopeptidase [Eubacteriales bacterium]|nr:M56 family metallopeptidase [Eubacteriales bacterium]